MEYSTQADTQYNTEQPPLILREYGRIIHKLVRHVMTIEDREKRNQSAKVLVELMRAIHPVMKDGQDYANKLWDDLYIMSGFELDVDSPFPLPEKTLLGKLPQVVGYNQHLLKYRHYGKNVERMIEKGSELEDEEERYAAILAIGKLMKKFYCEWNKDNVDDNVIVQHLREMSRGKLAISVERVKADGLFDSAPIRDPRVNVQPLRESIRDNSNRRRKGRDRRKKGG